MQTAQLLNPNQIAEQTPTVLKKRISDERARKTTEAMNNPRRVSEISPKELHAQIEDRGQRLPGFIQWLETQFTYARFFNVALFSPKGISDESSQWLSDTGNKYRYLLLLLQDCASRKERQFILANWLRQEGICEPPALLGREFAQYQRKAVRGPRGRFSFTQLQLALTVGGWKPYFERLLGARRKGSDLWQLGFEEGAIQSALGKRSAVAAACEYVASRSRREPRALANAYSHFVASGKKWIARSAHGSVSQVS